MVNFQIPDEALDQLSSLLDQSGKTQWEIGDFIVAYWEEMLKYVHPSEVREQHAELIRQFAAGTRADRTTLRDREKMSMFFTVEDRLRWGEVFSYHQFRALRSAGEDWEEYAVRAADENWSVARIRKEIKGEHTLAEVIRKRLDKIEDNARKIMDDEEVPDNVRTSLMLIPTIVEDTKELIPNE